MSKLVKALVAVVIVGVLAATVGVYVYINYIRDEAPAPLTVGGSDGSPTSGAVAGNVWQPTSASQVGYRVDEILFGQNTTAVGRTSDVTGTLTLNDKTVNTVDLSVNMATVKSDESRRDNQFNGRIMSTGQFPTATYKLTQPITLPGELSSSETKVNATGDLTLRGVTKPVTTELTIKRNGNTVKVAGSIPIKFADYQIPNPSIGGISTEDNGTLELLVVFEPKA